MSKRTHSFVGLELEPSAVHAVSVSANGHLTITEAVAAPLEAGVVRDGEVTDPEALSAVLRGLWAEHKGLPKRVRIGIANQKIVVRVIELPPISDPKELDAAVQFRAGDEIPMPLEAAVLDYRALDIVDTDAGPRQRILLVAARRDMVDRVLGAARDAGLRVEGLDLAAFGMIRALAGNGEARDDETVLYLSIGGLTNLAVAKGLTCSFTRVVGGGVEGIAVELAERQGLSTDHARGWLLHVGLAAPLDTVEGEEHILKEARAVLIDGVRRIASDVRNTLDFHLSQGAHGETATRCVLTGPAATIPGFAERLEDAMSMPVSVGVVDGAPAELGPERFSVAAGLAIEEAA